MVVIGVDAHKRTHTLVAVDEAGRKLGERTLAATSEGHLQAARRAGQWPGARFALEDCRHLTRRLHELDPGLQVPSRGLRRYHVLDELAAALAAMDGVVARIAAELVVRCREPAKCIKLPNGQLRIRRAEYERWLNTREEAA